MYELIQVSPHNYYIDCPAKIGLIALDEEHVCLIDSGSDKDAGRKIRQILDTHKWQLDAIYNTHSHADHIGGNHYLQSQTGCRIYAPGIESAFTAFPILEPAFLYGGYPVKELRHKFLMAQDSFVQQLTKESLPPCLTMIPLPGHSFDMVGFRTDEDTMYLADCLSSPETLTKYGIGFIYDIGAYLETLETVKGMNAACFIPAHAPVSDNIRDLAQLNLDAVHDVLSTIISMCRVPIGFDALLKRLFDHYNLTMNHQQYVLIGSTVRSYLAYLKENGLVEMRFDQNTLLWAAC